VDLLPELLPPSPDELRDFEILIRANHPFIVMETDEPERGASLIRRVADHLSLAYAQWQPDSGLLRADLPSFRVEGSESLAVCLEYITTTPGECLYHLDGLTQDHLRDALIQHKLVEAAHRLFQDRSAMVVPTLGLELPAELARVVTTLRLSTPTREQYYGFVKQVLRDLHQRMPVEVKLTAEDINKLLGQLSGLTFFEVKKVLTKIFVEDRGFEAKGIVKVAEAKREIIERSGVLEYFTAEETMAEVAGLTQLKGWLAKRKLAFSEVEKARSFGLTPPKGVLLVGVQGCGKSMCAKAIAREWTLPLIRLDPSSLYNKYFGESEKNLKRAIHTAEAMAPIVLWIDEMEKAFAHGAAGADDSGTSLRIFGTFLSWMQDKKDGVFVVATCNDIERLPPELLRKGRFDEIFFVDLPSVEVRADILSVHLRRRGRDPQKFDVNDLAARMQGFSGAEIEQVVLSALYSAFAVGGELNHDTLIDEIARTVPLYATAREKLDALRAWSHGRAVPAG
jgi:ATPase family associated with various cellular activities (AAA)